MHYSVEKSLSVPPGARDRLESSHDILVTPRMFAHQSIHPYISQSLNITLRMHHITITYNIVYARLSDTTSYTPA